MADFKALPKLPKGEGWIWCTCGALIFILLLITLLLGVVVDNAARTFWANEIVLYELDNGQKAVGEVTKDDVSPVTKSKRYQLKIGNRDLYGQDFRWFDEEAIKTKSFPENAVVFERKEHGNFYGFFKQLKHSSQFTLVSGSIEDQFHTLYKQSKKAYKEVESLDELIGDLSNKDRKIVLKMKELDYKGKATPETIEPLLAKQQELKDQFNQSQDKRIQIENKLLENIAVMEDANGRQHEISLIHIVRFYQPNKMSVLDKSKLYVSKIYELLFDNPRESNTEGGLFPAIFGTICVIFLMSITSFPFGVIAAIYLREYAKDGIMVRLVRIAVNNLAGIPSIVYGIFGLGFFVYGMGSSIDGLFFSERLPEPTFGTGGVLWASLTLGLLTVPVVIVSTEEALGAIPQALRENSLALGATKFQTLIKVLLPMASPGIMTGFILSMARAAGEVAPLMITGVVKLAPSLPIDGEFPFIHLDRKFMHLGFHIYDVGFQSPNVEAAKPMVYVTTLLLLTVVVTMCSVAILFRNKMLKKYKTSAI